MKVLECEHIIRQFELYDKVITAVNRVNLTIEAGEFVAVRGESGSGKTTLLNICAGLDIPNSGHVRLLGQDLAGMTSDELCRFRGKHVGFVFQTYRLVPYLTTLENILLPLSAADRDPGHYQERLSILVERLRLTDRLDHLPGELSGGQQQRVAIARALIHYPMILFADEPTGNLDRANADAVIDLLWSLCRELDQTALIVTHDDRLCARADRVLTMQNGEIVKASK